MGPIGELGDDHSCAYSSCVSVSTLPSEAKAPVVIVDGSYGVRALPIDEVLALGEYFEYPWRADTRRFADQVIARSWLDRPMHTVADVRALAPSRRSKMLRDVVTVNGQRETWRALHASHLSMDERLYAVMYWKWRATDQLAKRMRKRYRELDGAGAFEGFLGKAISTASMLGEFAPGVMDLVTRKSMFSSLLDSPALTPSSWTQRMVGDRDIPLNALRGASAAESMWSLTVADEVASRSFAKLASVVSRK